MISRKSIDCIFTFTVYEQSTSIAFIIFSIFYVILHPKTIVKESMDKETKIIILGTFLGLVLLVNLVSNLCERKGIDLFPEKDAKGFKNRIKRIIGNIILAVTAIMGVASLCVMCTDSCSHKEHSGDDEDNYEYYYDGHRPDRF